MVHFFECNSLVFVNLPLLRRIGIFFGMSIIVSATMIELFWSKSESTVHNILIRLHALHSKQLWHYKSDDQEAKPEKIRKEAKAGESSRRC